MAILTDDVIHGDSALGIHPGITHRSILGMITPGTILGMLDGDGTMDGMILGTMAHGHGGGVVTTPGTTTILGIMAGMVA